MKTMITVAVLLACATCASAAEIAVIVNKKNTNQVDKNTVVKIFQGHTVAWAQGGSIAPLDLPEENPTRITFSRSVVGKSVDQLKDIWAQILFTGKGAPPKVLASDDEVKKTVASRKNSIGYIRASSVDDSVRVVYSQ